MKINLKLRESLKIWIVIYPSITLFLHWFGEPLLQYPLYVRTLVLTLVLVPWMMFAGIPFINRLQAWLFGKEV